MPKPNQEVASVEVRVEPTSLHVGETGQVTATPLDQHGRKVQGVGIEITCDDPDVLLLGRRNGAGKREIKGVAPGYTIVYGSTTNLAGQEVTGQSERVVVLEAATPTTPAPVIEAIPSAVSFRVTQRSTLPIETQEVVVHSGTSEALEIAHIYISEEAPWLAIQDNTDDQVANYELLLYQEVIDTMPVGQHGTLLTFSYIHPVTAQTARIDVPVNLTIMPEVIVTPPDPEPPPTPEPIPLPPVGKLHPALMAPIVSREALIDTFGQTAITILSKMKVALDGRWAAEGDSWAGDYYSRTRARACLALAIGDGDEMAKARRQGEGYLNGYLYQAADGGFTGPSPHWHQPDTLWFLYKMFGDQRALYALQRIGRGWIELETNHVRWGQAVYQSDWRVQSRFMGGLLQVIEPGWGEVGQTKYVPWGSDANGWQSEDGTPENCLEWEVERNLGWQRDPTGDLLGSDLFGGGQYNWMVALLCQRFAQVYDVYKQDPRIVAWVEARLNYIWETQQSADPTWGWAFNYANKQSQEGGPYPAPDLNGLYLDSFGWLAARTGNPDYVERFWELLPKYASNVNQDGSKQVNQGFREAITGMSYIIGMTD